MSNNKDYVTVQDLLWYIEDNNYCNISGSGMFLSDTIYTIRKMGEGINVAYMVNKARDRGDLLDTPLTVSSGRFQIFDDGEQAIEYVIAQIGGIEKIDYWGDW
jgi:hypothetical protein